MTPSKPAPGGPLELGDPGAIAELRATLAAAGFDGAGVRAALGSGSELLARSVDAPLHLRRLAAAGPLGTLVRLLVLDASVPRDEAAAVPVELLERLGIAASGGGELHGLVRIVPHDDLLIVSDRRTPGAADAPDHVAGVHGPSLTLSHLTVRRHVETALDVGTGCGIQAILAARHAGSVVATDVNERALHFAAFNALLNGAGNVELRAGSFFEPVSGERFGLVTCNPPYVISPESAFLFRDSGLAGDTVSREVVRAAPAYLEEGAFAQMLVSWIAPSGEDWSAPLRTWVEGSGCDAWLLHHRTDDPLTHAGNWLRHELGTDPAAYASALERWLEYFERLGIEGIAVGAVILRRREGRNWVRADELRGDRLGPASEHILRVFAAGDFLAGEPDLLGERLVLARGASLEQRVVLHEREWTVAEIGLDLRDGLRFHANLDPATAGLLAALDGERTLAEVAAELARVERASRESVEQAALPVVREMLAAGFVEREEGPRRTRGPSPQVPA